GCGRPLGLCARATSPFEQRTVRGVSSEASTWSRSHVGSAVGVFSLVLHTHLPYVRRNGVWPSGEEFFHQAALESYLPLLGVLQTLADEGLSDALTLGLSPMIAHQMEDAHMLRELEWFLGVYEI